MNIPTSPSEETVLSRLQHRRHLRVFPVLGPTTVFVRGSQCRVVVQYHEFDHVELYVSLYAAFGMRLIVEQDEAGIYVVVRRRRLLGLFSRSELTVRLPGYCHLAFNLTPGVVVVDKLDGTLEIPSVAVAPSKPVVYQQLPDKQYNRIGAGEP